MNNKISINDFSPHLFWDVDKNAFDLDNHRIQMIAKVMEYGIWEDWTLLKTYYGRETIKEVALQLRSLDKVTLSFLATIFDLDKSVFRCYKHKQLVQNYWNS
jgi:hypothetical protein